MPSTQEFRRRIKSVNNTKQITKAMEMISSIKMQKSVKMAGQARSYIQNAWNMLGKMAGLVLPADNPLVAKRAGQKTAVILITSDRGLCGSYNSEVIKKLTQFAHSESMIHDSRVDIIAIGKVGAEYVRRYQLGNLVAEFNGFESNIDFEEIIPISKLTNGEFLAGKYDKVMLIYSHFESSLKQTAVAKQLLPISDEHIDHPELWEKSEDPLAASQKEFKFEPSPEKVFDGILIQILRTQIYGAVLEANASEHSARMVAMKNATDNASSLIDELKLIYNSVRQGNITSEIAEISGAAESMK
jgi:F-type H+-transporting ATPase subunit gamma